MNEKKLEEILNGSPQERKLFYDRRVFTYSYYIPERRSGQDRRNVQKKDTENIQNVA